MGIGIRELSEALRNPSSRAGELEPRHPREIRQFGRIMDAEGVVEKRRRRFGFGEVLRYPDSLVLSSFSPC